MHSDADLIERMARAAVIATGQDPNMIVKHAYGDEWNPSTQLPANLTEMVSLIYSPRWMLFTKDAARVLAMIRVAEPALHRHRRVFRQPATVRVSTSPRGYGFDVDEFNITGSEQGQDKAE